MKIGNIEYYGIIYKITNKINNKVYIGQTTKKNGFNSRYPKKGKGIERVYKFHKKLNEKGICYNKHLLSSIEKYGLNAFEVCEVLDIAFSKKELDIKEKTYIQYYDSYNNGYNNNIGGEGNKGQKGLSGEKNPSSRCVIQLDLEGNFIKEWKCITEASEMLNINRTDICGVCAKDKKSSGGFMWYYKEEYDKIKEKIKPYSNFIGEYNKRSVIKLSFDGKIVEQFNSLSEAAKSVNSTSVSKITNCCKEERKSYKGFLWVYLEDYDINKNYTYKSKFYYGDDNIIQLDLNMNYINKYDSIKEASLNSNTNYAKIREVCEHKRKSSNGFKWMYQNEYKQLIV